MAIPLLRHPESVVLVVVDGDDLVCVRQTRLGAPDLTLELPSGKIEPGEMPDQAAVRELAEECGLAAAESAYLGSFWVVPAYSTERCHVFQVASLSPAEAAVLDDDEDIEVERIPVIEAWERLSDAASLAALGIWRHGSR